jgi:glycosyltransferase involved in cell wall biosynthesis
MKKSVNVILDASPLGIGFYHRRARTGISRVIEQLVAGLRRSPDCELSLAAPTHLPETMRYVADNFPIAIPFVHTTGERGVARLENALLSPFGAESVLSKVIRRISYQTRRLSNTEHARFQPDQFPAQSVYHATFFPVPTVVQQRQAVRTVQSIYDMIPIMHPEWFTDGEQTVNQVLAGLSPESWVTTISQATKDDFCNHTNFNPDRVVPILLAASPSLFHPVADEARKQAIRQRLKLGDGPYFLSLATLEPRKNIDHLIRCFGQLIASRELPADVKLVLVGTKGWKFDDIMAEAGRNSELMSRLVFTGFVPDEDLAPLYAGALAFAYPSLYEGFGLPPLEAMQCGLPVITSNVSSLPEVVGDAAIQVAPKDIDALCEAMLTIARSPSVQADMSEKSLKRAAQFSWDKFTAEHVALYKRIIEPQS